jgi:type III pantothenate kinase
LPNISVERPDYVIGKNTTHAMQSGIYWGYIGLIEGTIKRIAEEINETPYVIATGGLAVLFGKGTTSIDAMDQYLTMKGLVYLNTQIQKSDNRKSA